MTTKKKTKNAKKTAEVIKAYKIFNSDWTCRGFKFKVGKTYHDDRTPIRCGAAGFHACLKPSDMFSYYSFDSNNKVAEVELSGAICTDGGSDSKVAAQTIRIVKEIAWPDLLLLVNQGRDNLGHSNTGDWNTGHSNAGHSNTGHSNTGHSNTGDWNTGDRNTGHSNAGHRNTGHSNAGHSNAGHSNAGDRNTGDRNTGDWNTGDRNTGHSNTGDWNTGHSNAGCFNTITPKDIIVFNKPCTMKKWKNAYKPSFLYFEVTEWVPDNKMTEQEKIDHPKFYVQSGYMKKLDYKTEFKKSWDSADKEDREQVRKLPNFDAAVFFEISGIDLRTKGRKKR